MKLINLDIVFINDSGLRTEYVGVISERALTASAGADTKRESNGISLFDSLAQISSYVPWRHVWWPRSLLWRRTVCSNVYDLIHAPEAYLKESYTEYFLISRSYDSGRLVPMNTFPSLPDSFPSIPGVSPKALQD